MVADGGEAISDIAALADQAALFSAVASDSTCWRVLAGIDAADLAAVAAARAGARETAWAQRAELTGAMLPASRVAGRDLLDRHGQAVLNIEIDATVVVAHSEKERAAPTFKKTFGYHPMLAFCDNIGEALAGVVRPGNAGSDTAADHIAVLDAALAQIPEQFRHGWPVLDQSALLKLLDTMRTADGGDLMWQLLATILQLLVDAEATAVIGGTAPTDRHPHQPAQRWSRQAGVHGGR